MVLSNMLNPGGVARSRPIIPMSTSASLGSLWAQDGGRVSIGARGRLLLVGEVCSEGEGLDRHSARGSRSIFDAFGERSG